MNPPESQCRHTVLDTRLHRPRTSDRFASLMELYESNYMLVRLLAPRLREMQDRTYESLSRRGVRLQLYDLRHARFTSTFGLSYRFTSAERPTLEPDLAIRLYHDARTCEVMSGLLSSRTGESRRVRNLDTNVGLNRFLNRWLAYCLREAHGFRPDDVVDAEPVRSESPVSRCVVS